MRGRRIILIVIISWRSTCGDPLSKGHMLYELAHAIFRQGLANLGPQWNAKVYEGRCSLL